MISNQKRKRLESELCDLKDYCIKVKVNECNGRGKIKERDGKGIFYADCLSYKPVKKRINLKDILDL